MKKTYVLILFSSLFLATTSFASGQSPRQQVEDSVIIGGAAESLEVQFPSVFKARKGLDITTSTSIDPETGETVTTTTQGSAQFVPVYDKIEPLKLDEIFGKTALANATGALNTKVDQLFEAVSKSLHLCRGEGDDSKGLIDPPAETAPLNEMHKKLHHCARYHPDQFSTLTNIMQPFMEWRQAEASNILKLYLAKLTSDRFMDRLEGRLMINCFHSIYGTGETEIDGTVYATPKDTAESLTYCANPENWNLHTLFPVLSKKTCMHTNLKDTALIKESKENLKSGPNMTEIGEYLSDDEGGYYEYDEEKKEYKRPIPI